MTGNINYQFIDRKAWEDVAQDYTKEMNYFGKHQLNAGVSIDYGKWHGNVNGKLVGNRSEQWGVEMADYKIVNAGLRYDYTKNLFFSLHIDNLTNQEYQIHNGYPMPGRSYYFNILLNY